MTNEPKIVQVKVSRQEAKEPEIREIKVVYPEGYKHQSMGYSKAPKTDWWKPEKLNKPQAMWEEE